MKNTKKKLKAFTLVELIIVITILAILATIAFISFQGYMKSSRDGNRLATINSVSKGLDLFQVKTGNYPLPENITGTGIVGTQDLAYVGNIADNISRVINVNKTPQDPLSKTNYIYGTDVTKTKYQIATVLEDTQASNIMINKTYADSGYKAKVTGNYNGLLKVGTSLYNLPSLIFTGSGNLISTETYFVADKSQNLPYKLNSIDPNNTQTTSQILTLLKSTATALTGVTITDWNSQSGSLSTSLGYAIDTIGQGYYGDKYFTEIKDKDVAITEIIVTPTYTCTGALVTVNADITNITGLTADTPYQTITSGNSCYYTCKTNYSGPNCETYTTPAPTYAISSCPTINLARNGTTPTRITILSNINDYIGCTVAGYTGVVGGYTYSGTITPENKMIMIAETTDTAGVSTTQWGLYGTDLLTLANITAGTNTITMTGNIVSWDGLVNTQKIFTALGAGTTYAAQKCTNKGTGRYLPATEELNQLYCYNNNDATNDGTYYGAGVNHADCVNKGYIANNKNTLSNFSATAYWSSTERGNYGARNQFFTHGYRDTNDKAAFFAVRCVSRF